MTYTTPDMADLRETFAATARPRYAAMTDPHDGNTGPGRPAIRLVDYMGDLDDYHTALIVGPFPDEAARDGELVRLRGLPLGRPEYEGGYEFLPSTMAARGTGLGDRTVDPGVVAGAATVAGFFAAFHGWPDDGDGALEVAGQIGLDGSEVPS